MKYQLKKLIVTLAIAAAVMPFTSASATQNNYVADTDMERALVDNGFKVKSATTAEQRRQIRSMPDDRFTMVKQGAETYYLYPDKRDNRLYAGDHWAFRAYQGFVKNNRLRKQGAFVFEVNPFDKANNKTVEVWHGWAPFPEWSPERKP
jgi:hypothetical protein